MKKVVTAEQLRAYRGRSEICLEEGTILTPSAQDAAREMGLKVRTGDCEVTLPRRDSGPVPALLNLEAQPPSSPGAAAVDGDLVIIAAFGQDRHGILAAVTSAIAQEGGSVRDVSQTILQGYFSLVLSVAIPASTASFAAFKERVKAVGQALGLEISVQKQAIFQAMHRI
jgi:ACT domain-containing protein